MITVEEYKNSRNSVSAKYTEFNCLKTRCPNNFFAFYEGKDAPYFYSKIEKYGKGKEVSPIKCNGKSQVKKIYKSLKDKNALNDISTGFFIDCDFDKNDEDFIITDFYVTDRYAIENYYTSERCVSKILNNEMGINEGNKDYDIVLKRFRLFQDSYHVNTSLFNAWYYTIKNNGCQCEVNLEEKLPNGFLKYDFSNWTVSKQYNLKKLNDLYSAKSSFVTQEDIYKSSVILDSNPMHRYRGKYELTCLVMFMQKIQEELNTGNGELTKNPYKNQITSSGVLSLWAQYADEDEKLKEYIERRVRY